MPKNKIVVQDLFTPYNIISWNIVITYSTEATRIKLCPARDGIQILPFNSLDISSWFIVRGIEQYYSLKNKHSR
jgi:hypothetical protein